VNAPKVAQKARVKKTKSQPASRKKPVPIQPRRVARSAPLDEASPTPRLGDKVYAAVLSGIMDDSFAVGDRLPTETALAERFAVSRPLVREALARLRDDGLVYSRQGSGSYVSAKPDEAITQFTPLSALTRINRIYEFRESVEADAAYWAAIRNDERTLAAIEQALADMEEAIESNQVGAALDFELHLAIAKASSNPYYFAALTSLRNQITSSMAPGRRMAILRQGEYREMARRQHRAIVTAIRTGDAERARSEMRRHLEMSRRSLLEGSDPR
jgi:GntR family transcriptional regulator, transcriptional repressor for pyruvate dehydrogenase complex